MKGKIHGKQIINDTIVKTFNGSTYSNQYLTSVSDSNILLSIDSIQQIHSFSLVWQGQLPIDRGGLNNSIFSPSEVLILSPTASSVVSSGYKFNDNGETDNDIWSADKIIDYHKKKKSSFRVGDGHKTSFILNHNLGSRFVIVQIFETETGDSVETEVVRIDEDNVQVFFKNPPSLEEYCVVIT
jgi:hypothetical protein